MPPGYYYLKRDREYARVYASGTHDSLRIIDSAKRDDKDARMDSHSITLLKPSFDFDVMTIPFKYRPSVSNFPRQLTTEFNGNLFFGFRLDRYHAVDFTTPIGRIKKLNHRALTLGTFGGIGAANISPSTTLNAGVDDYEGLILDRGISLMAGINNITVGVAVGWDYLTDRDKDIWIYQNKVWYGLSVSLNLN